ncbi:uncharacterized protein TNCV_3406911 [Trichonephila clavipes]|nr:uncharacterized protein TNCV_3406911 [Trichonephila clavipes]
MTFQVSLDEVTDVRERERRNVYFNHRKYEEDEFIKVQNKVMYLNLILTDKGPDVIPEFSSIELERHLKCGCIWAINKEACNLKQASRSVRHVAEALDLPRSTAQKIMRNILRYYPYKLQLVQELLPHDFETRHLFSLQFLSRLEVDPEWPWNILWTDETHFHLDDLVNSHNC